MRKLKYLIQRIKSMNYKNFFNTITRIHQKTRKSKIVLFFDMVYCGLKYQAGYMDYDSFEMYNLNRQERSTIITRGINNEFIRRLNDQTAIKVFNNKTLFNQKFAKYLKRDWLKLTGDNLNEFENFLTKHPEFIAKPETGTCGIGVEKIKCQKEYAKAKYQELITKGQTLIEEIATQCQELAELHPYSINTLRVVTVNQTVVTAYLRIGNKKNVVDNFHQEGLCAPVNIETGRIEFPAITKSSENYEEHPVTKKKIIGFQIPKWEEIKDFAIAASKEVKNVKYTGWDICLSNTGPLMIEGNEFPGHDLYQLPPHRKNNQGLLPIFEKAINKGEKEL